MNNIVRSCVIIIAAVFSVNTAFAQNSTGDNSSGRKDAIERMKKLRKEFDEAEEKKKKLTGNLSKLEDSRRILNQKLIETAALVKQDEAVLSRIEKSLGQLSIHEKKNTVQNFFASWNHRDNVGRNAAYGPAASAHNGDPQR